MEHAEHPQPPDTNLPDIDHPKVNTGQLSPEIKDQIAKYRAGLFFCNSARANQFPG
jgi:hypothetical protein